MNLGESIRHGTKWLLGGNLVSQILQFAFGIILARLLVPEDFGTLVTVQIFTGLAGFVSGGGMGQALIRAKHAESQDFQVVFTIQLALGLLVYAVFFIAAPWFALWYANPIYTGLLRLSAISFLLRPFYNLPNAWLGREMRFKQRAIIDLLCSNIGTIVSVVLAWQHLGVWSLVIGGIAGTVLSIFGLTSATPIRPALRFDAALAKELGLYGIKVTSNDIVSYVRNQIPNFVLGRLQGPTIVGLFNKADSVSKIPSVISGSVYDSMFRGLARIQENKDMSRYVYFRTIMLLTVYMLPIYVGLAWLAEPFVKVLYGAKWMDSAMPLSILSIGGIFACIGHPSGAVLAARNLLGREVVVQVITTVLVTAACYFGIQWGLKGVAWGVLGAWGYSTLHLNWLASRSLGARFKDLISSLGPGLLLNSLLCAVLFVTYYFVPLETREGLPVLYLLLMFCIGAFTYGLCFLYLPIRVLASESARWRKALRLARY